MWYTNILKKEEKKYKMIDLFAGAGGLTFGFYYSGFDHVETIKIWQPAINTYNFNFNKSILANNITNEHTRDLI